MTASEKTAQLSNSPTKPVCLNIAHRGARAYAPENTLPAFTKAKAFGCEMVELDVRMSKDGFVVVHHDESLQRCTDIAERMPDMTEASIWDLNLATIQCLDAGGWFQRELELPQEHRQTFLQSLTDEEIADYISADDKALYQSGKVKIPTLAETLELCNTLGLLVNIELKSPCQNPHNLIEGTLNLVDSKGMRDKVLVSSFDHDYLRLFKAHAKDIPIAALTDALMKAPVTYLRKLKANACNLGCFWNFPQHTFESKSGKKYLAGVARLRKSAIPMNVWTCNNPDEMRYLLAAGVSGIISDYPNRLSTAISSFRQKQASRID